MLDFYTRNRWRSKINKSGEEGKEGKEDRGKERGSSGGRVLSGSRGGRGRSGRRLRREDRIIISSKSDHALSDPSPRISRRSSTIILEFMHHDRSADNRARVLGREGSQLVMEDRHDPTIGAHSEVPHIANMSLGRGRAVVVLVVGVKMSTCRGSVSRGYVSVGVHVHRMLVSCC